MQQIHSLTIRVSTYNYVTDVVDNTTQFETRWFAGVMFILEKLRVWNEISSVSYHEHVTNVSVSETSRYHSRIHASEENGFRFGIVSDFLELSYHVRSGCVSVSHDPSQNSLHFVL